jgi:hypothetical protein
VLVIHHPLIFGELPDTSFTVQVINDLILTVAIAPLSRHGGRRRGGGEATVRSRKKNFKSHPERVRRPYGAQGEGCSCALLASADLRVLLRHVVLGDLLVFEEILDAGQAAEPAWPPLALYPPSSNSIVRLAQALTEIRPASRFLATRSGRSMSRLHTHALSPYSVSLASATASSSVSKTWIVCTGPNVSSCTIGSEESGTDSRW